ncbi:hypothetical protein BRN90_04140 [Xanthomonas oryzae pv. oryzae]|nr:hypothetical protein BRN90_04140 [Xanthomonas oryzae pv. oryzae]
MWCVVQRFPKASMKRLGMAILRVGGWEVTVALIAIDILIYAIKPAASTLDRNTNGCEVIQAT